MLLSSELIGFRGKLNRNLELVLPELYLHSARMQRLRNARCSLKQSRIIRDIQFTGVVGNKRCLFEVTKIGALPF